MQLFFPLMKSINLLSVPTLMLLSYSNVAEGLRSVYLLVVSCVWNNAKRATDPGLRSATPSCHPSSGSVLRHQSLKDHPVAFFSFFLFTRKRV